MTLAPPWRVAIITVLPMVAGAYAPLIRHLGHEPAAVIVPRRRAFGEPPTPSAAEHVAGVEAGVHEVICQADLCLTVPNRPRNGKRPSIPGEHPRVAVDDAERRCCERVGRDQPGEAGAEPEVGIATA